MIFVLDTMLKKLIFVDKESWVKISRQIRLISRGLEPQTRHYNSDSTQLDMSEVNSPERKRPRQEDMDSKVVLRFHKLSEKAHTPTRGSKLSAGYDLYSAEQCTIPAKGKKCVKTDIQIELPPGCYGRVAPRSGLAVRHFIDVGAGVIDEDYRGPVGVVMFNFDSEDFQVKPGDRIAQLICEKIFLPDLEESKEKLSETARGAGGFGSTGVSLTETNGTSKDDNKTNGHGATNGDKTNGHASVDTTEATNGETTPKPTEDESKEKN